MTVSVFDITVCDYNIGNRIVTESVYEILYELFPKDVIVTLPYWEPFGKISMEYIKNSRLLIYGGGNHLTADLKDIFWGINKDNYKDVRNTVLLGVGWWKYQDKPGAEMAEIYQTVLSHEYWHSVRDNHTRDMLASAGIRNVLVTGCPTMWRLTPEHCAQVPDGKADDVLFTFSSDYSQDCARDLEIYRQLAASYKNLYFWPQGPADCEYIKKFGFSGEILPANLPALEKFLASHENLDYVGTRLHAGIKALHYGRRTLIIAIDNRAREAQRDFSLPVLGQEDVGELGCKLCGKLPCRVVLPLADIARWKEQFTRSATRCI